MGLLEDNPMAERGPSTMAPHAFYILLSLADDDRHGSAIVREVLEVTDGAVRLWPVKLYSTLDELAGAGYIAELGAEGEHPEGKSRKRRYYRITREGRAALEREAQRLHDLAAAARARNRSGNASSTRRS